MEWNVAPPLCQVTMSLRILLVDDHEVVRTGLKNAADRCAWLRGLRGSRERARSRRENAATEARSGPFGCLHADNEWASSCESDTPSLSDNQNSNSIDARFRSDRERVKTCGCSRISH